MNEYIKRKDAFEILQSRLDSISQMSYLNMDWHELNIMRDAIENAIDDVGEVPAADVQPFKHGRWDGYICSECNVCADYFILGDFYFDEKPNFCPNCGAKMDGDTNA